MNMKFNRRDFVKASSLAGLGLVVPSNPLEQLYNLTNPSSNSVFPNDFLWGVAASAPETESREGRGRSNWDVYVDNMGGSKDGTTNMRNTEFEKRYLDDLKLLQTAGVKAFRFSFSWPRVQPETPGTPNAKAMAYYDHLVDSMLEHGIEPIPTLFHWDMPLWAGDFTDRDVSYRLQDYADIVSRLVGDRTDKWLVYNEPSALAAFAYGRGLFAPGYSSKRHLAMASHNINLGYGRAVEAIKSNATANTKISSAFNMMPFQALSGNKEDQDAANYMTVFWNYAFSDPLYGKGYPEIIKPLVEPYIQPGDMQVISANKPDFFGANFYARTFVKADNTNALGISLIAPPKELEATQELPYDPNSYAKVLLDIHKRYDAPDIYATEFGFPVEEGAIVNGVVSDPTRIRYIQGYIKAAEDAVRQGVKLKGMFYWSPTDNWEWTLGSSKHFGLIHVDPQTLERTPKQSLGYYGECIKANGAADIVV